MDTTIEFCAFELVFLSNFTLNNFGFFRQNLPRKGFSGLKQKKGKLPLNSAFSDQSRYQVSAQIDSFYFLEQIHPKKVFPVKKKKSEKVSHATSTKRRNQPPKISKFQLLCYTVSPNYCHSNYCFNVTLLSFPNY